MSNRLWWMSTFVLWLIWPLSLPAATGVPGATSHAWKPAWLSAIEVPADTGELRVNEENGKITSVEVEGSPLKGEFTRLNGFHAITLKRQSGEKFTCSGWIYIGISDPLGTLDWAFAIDDVTSMPKWVKDAARECNKADGGNMFLQKGRDFHSGGDAKPFTGEEFSSGWRLFLVGKMVKVKGRWEFQLTPR
ncbi:MAG: hypothetical protein WCP22_08910 [Chlamydiota bacterium]